MHLNKAYGGQYYIPYSVGVLVAYLQKRKNLFNFLEISPFMYKREEVSKLADQVEGADILGMSCYCWNFCLNIALAKELRERGRSCEIVGGPHVPLVLGNFLDTHPYIDVVVHGEGEETFSEYMSAYLEGGDYTKIKGLSWRDPKTGKINENPRRALIDDLNIIPSPYLISVFDDLMKNAKGVKWQALWETNRGCPYSCSFCDWGFAEGRKLRRFAAGRLEDEIKWFTNNKIEYLFGCDSNFGFFDYDEKLAHLIADAKKIKGYPKQFFVSFAKRSNKRVLRIAKILKAQDIGKGITLSMQSLDSVALKNIKRDNIKIEVFHDLQAKYIEEGISTTSELIIGLPGETYDSFVDGVDLLLNHGQHNGILILNCSVLPNAEMADPEYVKRFKIETIEQPVFQAHSTKDEAHDSVVELEKIIVSTSSMDINDWKKIQLFSWAVLCFHSLGLLQAICIFMHYFHKVSYKKFYQSLLDYAGKNKGSLIHDEIANHHNFLSGVRRGWGMISMSMDFMISAGLRKRLHIFVSLRI